MKLLRKMLCGYHLSFLWRRQNFRSIERFNEYTYQIGFFWAGILSSFHIILPLSILFSLVTDMPSNLTYIISAIIAFLFSVLVSSRLKTKFPISWYEKHIVAPTNRMTAVLRRKFLTYVNLLFLLNVTLLVAEIILFMIIHNKLH